MISVAPRKLLILAFILVLLFLYAYSTFGISSKTLNSLCSSTHVQQVFPGPQRPSGEASMYSTQSEDAVHWTQDDIAAESSKMVNTDKLLRGNATLHFRDNLRPEYQYITGWGDGGFTNQFMAICNLLFLSLLTPHRIPIVPPFVARPHLPTRAGYRALSDVFDLDRWARSINKEMVEWQDVKDLHGLAGKKAPDGTRQADGQDVLGCWSVWTTANLEEKKPYDNSFIPDHVNLDISHTPVPREARLFPFSNDGETHVGFNPLAILSQATTENPNPLSSSPLGPIIPSRRNNARLPPDSQLACYDFLYRVSSTTPWEWEQGFSSAWNLVGKHAHWSDRIRSLTRRTLATTLDVLPTEVLPPIRGDADFRNRVHPYDIVALSERDRVRVPYISVHVRHGDFMVNCTTCPPDLSTYARLVKGVEQELHSRGYAHTIPVIVTSDEADEEWWGDVERYGWKRVQFPPELELDPSPSHNANTGGGHGGGGSGRVVNPVIEAEPTGGWAPGTYGKLWDRMFVEVAIQGFAVGFVGTHASTMSLVAKRRVEHWQRGVVRLA